ncbi:hypothetical protein T484DRAFT_1779379 [Baffinella frigidus]|nr:hypothetical protein T484DRAFT_1779379 [Cryptophyta sp. CCMP2293]
MRNRQCIRDMVSPSGAIGMRNRQCIRDDCAVTASFAFRGGRPAFCLSHREEGMVNVRASRKALDAGAGLLASLDLEETTLGA